MSIKRLASEVLKSATEATVKVSQPARVAAQKAAAGVFLTKEEKAEVLDAAADVIRDLRGEKAANTTRRKPEAA